MLQFAIYSIFLALSLICIVVTAICIIKNRNDPVVPVIVKWIIGIFFASFCFCLPIDFAAGVEGLGWDCIEKLFVSVHHSIQVFVVNLDYSYISDTVLSIENETLRNVYLDYGAVLFVIAPFLTFSAVLMFFKHFLNGIKYNLCHKKPLYIFSELNEHAVILAKSILKKEKDSKLKPMIVFTDVMFNENETDYEMNTEAKKIKALCLKIDIVHLNILSKKQDTEIFLIGEDESENVRQASIITNALNQSCKKLNVKIFVFAAKESSRYTLDSLEYTNLLNRNTVSEGQDNSFKLRRINCIRQLVWRTVPDMDIIGKSRDGIISIMIAGMGSYGMEFFKMLVWFCQIDGCKLEINLFDKTQKSDYGGIESVIRRQCPELIEKNGSEYDIMMFDGVDFTTDGFARLLEGGDDVSERLGRTDIAIVCTGDDDLNIETAVYLREIFDRFNHVGMTKQDSKRDLKDEVPVIYSVVYDSRKYGSVSGDDKSEFLKNHKKQKYHINFIGCVDEQYSYDNIYSAEKEATAFEYHVKWADTAVKAFDEKKELIFDEFRARGYTDEQINMLKEKCFGKEVVEGGLKRVSDSRKKEGYDKLFAILKSENMFQVCEKLAAEGLTKELDGLYTEIDAENERKLFDHFEFFRQSSMATSLHQEYLKGSAIYDRIKCQKDGTKVLCECENCVRRKKMEHTRWMAYMRSEGYSYRKERFDRAKLHNDLVDWDQLSKWEQVKD